MITWKVLIELGGHTKQIFVEAKSYGEVDGIVHEQYPGCRVLSVTEAMNLHF